MSEVFQDSYLRANIIAWLPLKREDSVLYVGTERVIADRLAELSENVECVTWETCAALENKYDYIISFQTVTPTSIKRYYNLLNERGRLVVAAENAYGLKYLAGTKESGSGTYFGGVEGAEASAAYTKEELQDFIEQAGFLWQKFYYPFPDYHFAMSIYSDDYLPKQGELIDQVGNFKEERLVLFDESKAADALLLRGKFQDFSNSYLVIAAKSEKGRMLNARGESISYVKFSNDRGSIHNIRTYITESAEGKCHLLKVADNKEAIPQIAKLAVTAKRLQELYAGTRLKINRCFLQEDTAELEFLKGRTMEEILDGLLLQGAYDKAEAAMFEVFEAIDSCKGSGEFQQTEEFTEIFGNVRLPDGLRAVPVADIDMIMPNILVEEDGTWTVIDYEWSFHIPVPVHFIRYRAIHYYADTTTLRKALDSSRLYQKAGITKEELEVYQKMEENFQRYVLGTHIPIRQKYKESGKPAYHITSLLHVADELERRRALQIYFDRGAGFREEDTLLYHSKALDGTYHLEIPVDSDVSQIRIDPGSQACTVAVERLAWKNGKDVTKEFISNGHKMAGNLYLFDTEDPNLLLSELPKGERILLVDLRIDSMSLEAAEWIAPKIDAKYKLKKMLKR